VTIPGLGDLSPPHRHVPIGRWLVTILVFALLAGGGYAAFLGLTGGSSGPKAKAASHLCPSTPAPGPTDPHRVRLVVLNATLTTNLAAHVKADLIARGFHVTSIGNALKLGTGVAVIDYGAGLRLDAQAVADQIEGATLTRVSAAGVTLKVGPQFHRLLTVAQARVARTHFMAQEPRAQSPSTSPTC
jgi:hypothetical protein